MEDLFEHYEKLPKEVQEILERYSEDDETYENCEKLIAELKQVGYTCSYYLDASPYDLRKLDAELVTFNLETKSIRINYPDYNTPNRMYNDLLDALGDADIIQANELNQHCLVMCGLVYTFDDNDERNLLMNGSVTLDCHGELKDYADAVEDKDFLEWYYNR